MLSYTARCSHSLFLVPMFAGTEMSKVIIRDDMVSTNSYKSTVTQCTRRQMSALGHRS